MNIRQISDFAGMGLSIMCAVHCLLLPILLITLPSLVSLGLDNEVYHYWMIFLVIPISIYALSLGCRKHNRYSLLFWGFLGLSFLIFAILGEDMIGEFGEKLFTLAGAALLATGHYFNFRLCQTN
tara:strand:+ start:478 stop:852 length:375 start_codon:yes stop_codon:yes gene_type:complete